MPRLIDSTIRLRTALILAAIEAVLVYYAGWSYWQPKSPGAVLPTVAVKLPDGGMRLGNTPAPAGKAPSPSHAVPKGYKVDSVARIQVKPKPLPDAPARCECKAIDLELVTSHGNDGQPVAEVHADGGEVTGGTFTTPALLPALSPARSWAAGALVTQRGDYGAWIDRDLGPFRAGLEAVQYGEEVVAAVRVGGRF